jgi:hypothetical protein
MISLRFVFLRISLAVAASPLGAVSINQFNVPFTEDFNTLANTTTGSVVPAGWEFNETGSGANTTYAGGTGSSSTGNTYSFGATASTDRAFGAVRTSSVITTLGTVITNDADTTITQLTIQYVGEQWRMGATGRADRLDFGYSLDATSVITGAWNDVAPLGFIAPTTAGLVGALDGNAAENQVTLSHSLMGLSLAPGASLWLRWTDFDASGSDDGLAIDSFAITAVESGLQSVPDGLPMSFLAPFLAALLRAGASFRRMALT